MPLKIDYVAEDFPLSPLNTTHATLNTNWGELLHAALTVGRPGMFQVFQHGASSLYEAIYRVATVRMALTRGRKWNHLKRTAAFQNMDPTEKGFVSYHLGMVLCTLFARKLLETPWLLHLDVFKDQIPPQLIGGRSRPDLVGFSPTLGRWHAFESKGRSSKPSLEDRDKAKAQAQRLVSVGGNRCHYHIGSFAYFENDVLCFYWKDPAPPSEITLPIPEPQDRWRYVFQPVLALLDRAGLSPADFRQSRNPAYIEDLGIKISIDPIVADALSESSWLRAVEIAANERERITQNGFFETGILVASDQQWDSYRPEAQPLEE